MRRPLLATALGLALGALACPALADPCKAVPDRGPTPTHLRPGSTFSGRVVHVIDGDGLCVATGLGPTNWVEVRLEDFYAPELSEPGGDRAKAALRKLALGRTVTCRAGRRSYDRVVARCELAGRSLADRLRSAGIQEGGRGRR
ncbi:MAG: nuclease [Pseudomonadota bacterium]|jgi:endonuclease YncB( thermonuclease family)|uniref:thermonuclease family protein n=1 Tax=Phenylobacterium sp. TaxID=1871053 RepID=UPI001A28492E|nr:nuclease [Phenylobacterium sp.]MBJ7410244.1 nuclease [Phenylobacterium sp.]